MMVVLDSMVRVPGHKPSPALAVLLASTEGQNLKIFLS